MSTFNKILLIISMCMLPAIIYMFVSSIRVNSTFKKFNQIDAKSKLTGHEAARKILDSSGLKNVDVLPCVGHLTDHYDPRNNTVYLSESTYNSQSVSALGIAAHEVGHAIQYSENYMPVKLRTFLVPAVSFTSKFSMPLLLISFLIELILGITNPVSIVLLTIAIAFYAVYAIFTLITLPVEFNASKRAKKLLVDCNIITGEEVTYSAKVLSSAAQTYVASFAFSIIQFARLLMMLLSRRK